MPRSLNAINLKHILANAKPPPLPLQPASFISYAAAFTSLLSDLKGRLGPSELLLDRLAKRLAVVDGRAGWTFPLLLLLVVVVAFALFLPVRRRRRLLEMERCYSQQHSYHASSSSYYSSRSEPSKPSVKPSIDAVVGSESEAHPLDEMPLLRHASGSICSSGSSSSISSMEPIEESNSEEEESGEEGDNYDDEDNVAMYDDANGENVENVEEEEMEEMVALMELPSVHEGVDEEEREDEAEDEEQDVNMEAWTAGIYSRVLAATAAATADPIKISPLSDTSEEGEEAKVASSDELVQVATLPQDKDDDEDEDMTKGWEVQTPMPMPARNETVKETAEYYGLLSLMNTPSTRHLSVEKKNTDKYDDFDWEDFLPSSEEEKKDEGDNDFLDIPVRRKSRRLSTGEGMRRANSNASLNSTKSVESMASRRSSSSSIGGISVTASLKRSLSSAGLRMSGSRRSLSSQNLKNTKKKVASKLR